MDKFKVNLKKKMDKYIKLNGISYAYFERSDGFKNLDGIRRNGVTTFKTLFQTSKFLGIDIRNFLMFDDHTYIFENSFDTSEEFFVFLGSRFKNFRLSKNIKATDVLEKTGISLATISSMENAKLPISLKNFYVFLDVLEATSDEFFLKGEKYEIIGNEIKNKISIDDFNNRIYELEEIKGRIVGGNITTNPNTFPTLHGFLKICKSLKVTPKDFFDFEKKEFDKQYTVIDVSNSANFIKHQLELRGVKVQRYIKLDSIFLFCNEKNISISDFFDVSSTVGNISQTHSNITIK
mgnify:FL=1